MKYTTKSIAYNTKIDTYSYSYTAKFCGLKVKCSNLACPVHTSKSFSNGFKLV